MNNENANVDRLFREGLRDYEESFPSYVWDNVKDQLDNKKKQRTIFYLRSLAASVVVVLAFGAGYFLTQNPAKKTNTIVLNTTIKVDTTAIKTNTVEVVAAENEVQPSVKKVRNVKLTKNVALESNQVKEQEQPLTLSIMSQPEYAMQETTLKTTTTKVEVENKLEKYNNPFLKADSVRSIHQPVKEEKKLEVPIQKESKEKKESFFTRLKNLFKK